MKILLEIAKFSLRAVYFVIKIFPTQNKILFMSRQSNRSSKDFELLAQEIKNNNPKIKIIMLTKTLDKGIINKMKYAFHMWEQMYHIATSRVVVIDGYQIVVSLLKHKKSLKVIQVWHALGSLKKFGYSIAGKAEGSKQEIIESMNMHKNYDLVLASSEISKKNFVKAFNVDENKVEVLGLPRIDFLTSEEIRKQTLKEIYKEYPKLKNKKNTILYVPTFRKNEDIEDNIEKLVKKVNLNKYNLIVKLHSNVEKVYIDKEENAVQGDKFTGMELLHLADYVVTDYSAIVFEAAIAKKPIFFYTYDLEKYKNSRDMYIDFEKEMPGLISKDPEIIIKAIENNDYNENKIYEFANKYVETIEKNNTSILAFKVKEYYLSGESHILKEKVKKVMRRGKSLTKILGFKFFNIIFSMCKLDSNKVLFLSDVRNELGGNLKAVYSKLDSCYNKVIILKENRSVKEPLNKSIKRAYEISTSKYILLDDFSFNISAMRVRKNQEVCQLWHGPGAFKKFGYSRDDKKNLNKFNTHKNYTKAIVTSDNIIPCYAEGFGMDREKIKATGYPRTDLLLNNKYIISTKKALYKKHPKLKDKKVIMFAPTYRGDNLKNATYDFSNLDLDKIYSEFKDDYVFIFKWHPAIYNNIKEGKIEGYNVKKYKDFFMDFSEYRDINDLLLITDILVTDYSSVIFDYFLLNKPIVYFTYDLEDYENTRGLYYDLEKYIYGELANNTNELIKYIKQENMMNEKRKEFNEDFMDACDGKATQKVIKWIFGEKNNNEK